MLYRFFTFLFGALFAGWVWAQDMDASELAARQITEQERARLSALLAQPIDLNGLKLNIERQVNEKLEAALKLGDRKAEEELAKIALEHVPTPPVLNLVARISRDKHQYARAVELHQQLIPMVPEIWKPFYMAHVANDYRLWWKHAEADEWIKKAEDSIAQLQSARLNPVQQRNFLRSQRFTHWVKSFIEQRKGRWPQAVEAAEKAEVLARRAVQIQVPQDTPLVQTYVREDLADALSRKIYVYRNVGRLVDAEQALRDYLRFAKEVNLTAIQRSVAYSAASSLRFAQRDFGQAQKLGEKSLELFLQTGRAEYELGARNRMIEIAVAYAGQKNWLQAQQWIDRLDRSFPQKLPLERVPYPFERGYIALENGQTDSAAILFARLVKGAQDIYGDQHYFTAQSRGLQGVALWRSSQTEPRKEGVRLMAAAIADMVHPRNADYLDSWGYRPEIRQTIISTYIESLAATRSPEITQALGLADWLKAGSTQEALADAAVRAAAQTQGLADLVRQEQDARQEIKGLRDYLAGQAGGAQSTLPEIAAQMRDRISSLEKQRLGLQAQIKAAFPGYERLVRPLPPQIDEIAKVLSPQEALIFLMPEPQGVHVWAVAQQDGKAQARHHWVSGSLEELNRDITALRHPLEALGETGLVRPFPDQIALRLYQKLLAPLGAEWLGKPQWIVAAAGPLARIPFSLLQTEAARPGQPARWLIDQVALTHVPSVGSWLSLRALPRHVKPDQALMAWGDPLFKSQASTAPAQPVSGPLVRALRSVSNTSADIEGEVRGQDNLYHDIPPLPETREELLQLAKALDAQPNDLIMGAQATRQSVLAANQSGALQRKRVVVFATHGLMSGELPGLSQPALAMAANGEETRNPLSPLLTLEDVLGLKLNSDWVVLSACNTASGDGKAEEALSGLARGFFYAGSRSLLVTHWAVESDSAKELTTRTFAHFTRHPDAPKAESLRQAILQVKADPRYAHPVFWAPYVLVGDSAR